jgi:hypothetical protein
MKIAVVSLNNLDMNGETYFALDMVKGLNRIGHQADFIALNFRGRPTSRDCKENAILFLINKWTD